MAQGQSAPTHAGPWPVLHEWGLLIQAYHHAPDPQLLAKTLAYVRATTAAEQDRLLSNNSGTLGFYQTWLAAHPEARAQFRQQLAQVGGSVAWQRLLRSLTDPPSTTRPAGLGPAPQHNDYLWGAFFATGQPRYLDSLVAQCRYLTVPSPNANYRLLFYTTGGSAIWSLRANARQDSTVAVYLRNPVVRQRLADVLAQYQQGNP